MGLFSRKQDVYGAAFPELLRDEVRRVSKCLPKADLTPFGDRPSFHIAGAELSAPYRIYNAEPSVDCVQELSNVEQLVLHCLYTRHCDGRVRQQHLAAVLEAEVAWAMPFIAMLLGEYVVHIHVDIARALASSTLSREAWELFATENQDFLLRTRTRYLSYLTEFGWEWAKECPGQQLAGRDAFAAIGLWPNRFARRISRKAARWHLPPYSPGSAHGTH